MSSTLHWKTMRITIVGYYCCYRCPHILKALRRVGPGTPDHICHAGDTPHCKSPRQNCHHQIHYLGYHKVTPLAGGGGHSKQNFCTDFYLTLSCLHRQHTDYLCSIFCFCNPGFSQVCIMPATEPVLGVPSAFSVPNHNDLVRGHSCVQKSSSSEQQVTFRI